MTKSQLKALAQLPEVISALESLAKDAARLREAMAQAGGFAPHALHGQQPARQEISLPVVLDTPERREFNANRRLPKRQQEAIEQGLLNSMERNAKLAQFTHDGGPNDEPAEVLKEQLTTLSEAQ